MELIQNYIINNNNNNNNNINHDNNNNGIHYNALIQLIQYHIINNINNNNINNNNNNINNHINNNDDVDDDDDDDDDYDDDYDDLPELIQLPEVHLVQVENHHHMGPEDSEEERSIPQCSICLHNKCTIVLIPCGHVCACTSCSHRIDKCPICRSSFVRRQALFFI